MKRVVSLFYSSVWAITPDYLKKMQTILTSWDSGLEINAEALQLNNKLKNSTSLFAVDSRKHLKAQMSEDGSMQAAAERSENEKVVLIIPIIGATFKRADMLQMISGARSVEAIISDLDEAQKDDNVLGVVLLIDSPGGQLDGTEALAERVKNFDKPIVSYTDGLMASAAYWVGCQSRTVYARGKTCIIGSIGTVYEHTDESGKQTKEGEVVSYILPDKSKEKLMAPENKPLDDEAISRVKRMIIPLNEFFINSVTEARGAKLKNTDEIFTARVYNGEESLEIGLIDKIGSMDDAINEVISLSGYKAGQGTSAKLNNTNTNLNKVSMKTKAEYEELSKTTGKAVEELMAEDEAQEKVKNEGSGIDGANTEAVVDPPATTDAPPNPDETEGPEDTTTPKTEEELRAWETQLSEKEAALNLREQTLNQRENALNEREAALKTREDAVAQKEGGQTAQEEQVANITSERDSLKTDNDTLRTEKQTLTDQVTELTEANRILSEATGKATVVDTKKDIKNETEDLGEMPKDPIARTIWLRRKAKAGLKTLAN